MVPVVDVPVVVLADEAGSAVTMVTRVAGDEPVAELLVCESHTHKKLQTSVSSYSDMIKSLKK